MGFELKKNINKLLNTKGRRKRHRQMNQCPECICPECHQTIMHQASVPCFQMKCPKCGTPMARRFS
ncbi:hypothetical protein MHK_003336 [Candidatus Magnetomorum sp. HK-1]|nr:hypothetical protein MHK_003336 [Candidatus Magnetomorum sp. HK-1]